MKPRSSTAKTSPRTSFVETKWKDVFDLFEVSKLRRGKAMAKQGQVVNLSIENRFVSGKILGPKMRFSSQDYEVTLPLIANGEVSQTDVAEMLYLRPDWLGTLLDGTWNKEFWAALSAKGLDLVPGESQALEWLRGVTCTCRDPQMPCFHVAAVLFAVLGEMEEYPLFALRFLGLQDNALLEEAHHFGSQPITHGNQELVGSERKNTQGSLAGEEELIYQQTSGRRQGEQTSSEPSESIRHRLPPNWHADKQKTWWEHYMARK